MRGYPLAVLAVVAIVVEDDFGDGCGESGKQYEHGVSPWVRSCVGEVIRD